MPTLRQIVDNEAPADPVLHSNPLLVERVSAGTPAFPNSSSEMDAREFSTGKREKLAKKGKALPHGGFPIVNRKDLSNAKRAIGRAKNRAATIRHINKRAAALGAPGFGKDKKEMAAGGAGSGCHGPNCGRKGGGETKPSSSTAPARSDRQRRIRYLRDQLKRSGSSLLKYPRRSTTDPKWKNDPAYGNVRPGSKEERKEAAFRERLAERTYAR